MGCGHICKAKRKDNNEWKTGYYVCLNGDRHFIYTGYAETDCDTYYLDCYEVIPETVRDCTGLTDKNTKFIFEGDILESRASENKEDWKKWVVTFSDGSFCFEREIPRKRKHKYEQNLLCVDEIELYGLTIVGNVHDNLELLDVNNGRNKTTKAKKYRKKPAIIEAYQTDKVVHIKTPEGTMKANIGDYIITGIKGEQYPCKPDIFEQTYELVEEDI